MIFSYSSILCRVRDKSSNTIGYPARFYGTAMPVLEQINKTSWLANPPSMLFISASGRLEADLHY